MGPDHRPGDVFLSSVTDDLSEAESGVEFVYRSLDRLQRRTGAEELLVIVDQPPLGRQAFKAGRQPLDSDWSRELVKSGAPGLHARPDAVDDAVASSLVQLCGLALQLDIARHESLHDPLTGLLNRRAFDDLLEQACAKVQRYGWGFAVVVVDLDNFKWVNDQHGHAAGDAALVAVADRLRQSLRVGDVAARLGGDEFALVVADLPRDAVLDFLGRLQDGVRLAVPNSPIRMSAGCAMAPDDSVVPDALLRIADERLYEGKRR